MLSNIHARAENGAPKTLESRKLDAGANRTSGSGGTNRWLTTKQAAHYCGLSPSRLEKFRVYGGGPAYHKFGGKVQYLVTDLDAWIAERRVPGGSRND